MARILVIDDDPFIRQFVVDSLSFEGYEVETAEDGFAGLRALAESRFDAVLLDLMMPGMSGHDVLKRIRESSGYSDIPVVMLTAFDDDTNAWQAWSGGVDYFLGKPFDPTVLVGYLQGLHVTAS
jgi:DNA-binding response OmpR family regulator